MNLKELLSQNSATNVSRRDLLTTAAKTSVIVAAVSSLAGCGGDDSTVPINNGGNTNQNVAVLNFALNLEYLEAEFYAFAVNGSSGLNASQKTGVGTQGETTGGSRVNLTGDVADIANEIRRDEVDHVLFLRSALGANAVAKPAINLNALGLGFGNQAEFLTLARAFEDVGVSAYAGAATLITNPDYLQAAAQILATEAYHAGNIRLTCVEDGVACPPVDNRDVPPTNNAYFTTGASGLAVKRTTRQVLDIVYAGGNSQGGFFPNGFNGTIRS